MTVIYRCCNIIINDVILSVKVVSTDLLIEDTVNKEANIVNRTENLLRIQEADQLVIYKVRSRS